MGKLSNILFYLGDAVLFLLGSIHLVTHFLGSPVPKNEDQKQFLELYSNTTFEMPSGELRTYEDILNAFSLYFGILAIGLAILMWFSARNPSSLRPSLIVATVLMVLLAGVTFKYAILPPLVMMLMVAFCFFLSFLFSIDAEG